MEPRLIPRTPLAFAAVWLMACASAPAPATTASGRKVTFSLPSDGGSLVTVPIANARSTVLDFFAPTCAPCKDTVPALVAKRADLEAKGARLVLVGVLSDSESTEDARRALRSWGVESPFLVDRGRVSDEAAGVRSLPATLILDPNGTVRYTAPPRATADDVIANLK